MKSAVNLGVLALAGVGAYNSCTPSYVKQSEWACHQVLPGESMYSIAVAFNSDVEMICDYNINSLTKIAGYSLCSSLKPGQWLRVPPTCVEEPGVWTCGKFNTSFTTLNTFDRVMNNYNAHMYSGYLQDVKDLGASHTNVRLPALNTKPLAVSLKFPCQPRRADAIDLGGGIELPQAWDCHQVQVGESFEHIQEAYGASVEYGNPPHKEHGLAVDNIPLGPSINYGLVVEPGMQVQIIRRCIWEVGKHFCYKMRVHDTITSIGELFDVDPSSLCAYNAAFVLDCNQIRATEFLRIPIKADELRELNRTRPAAAPAPAPASLAQEGKLKAMAELALKAGADAAAVAGILRNA
jgi:hypothetical protein